MIERNIVLLEQVSGQLGRGQILRRVIPLEASGVKTGMLNAYRMLIIPEVARVEGDILLMHYLVYRAIAINDIVDADAAVGVLEHVERILSCALDIVDHHLQNCKIVGTVGSIVGAGSF